MEAARGSRTGLPPIARGVMLAGLPALGLSAYSENPGHTMLAVASLMAVSLLVWRPGEPPILLFVCGMQWLQGALDVFHADLLGAPLWSMSTSRSLEDAATLTLIWVVVFAAGSRLALVGARRGLARAPGGLAQAPDADVLRPEVLFRLYLVWTVALAVFERVAPTSLFQAVVAASDLRWAVVFAIFWMVVRTKAAWHLLALVFAVEVVAGTLSYFSDFKRPVYLLAIAFLAADYRIRPRHFAGFLAVAAFAIYLGILWSAVKQDYRRALNRDTGEQVAMLDRGERLQKLGELLGTVDGEVMERGLDNMVERFAYLEYMGWVLDHVPAIEPHAEGELHAAALRHILMPRLFFPDKEPLESDTRLAERYTGLFLSHENRQTSISIGTPADGYVDFGRDWMHLSALLLGLLAGFSYRLMTSQRGPRVLSASLAVALLLPLATLELSVVKLLGGHVTRLIAAVLLWKLAIPPAMQLMTSARERRGAADSRPVVR